MTKAHPKIVDPGASCEADTRCPDRDLRSAPRVFLTRDGAVCQRHLGRRRADLELSPELLRWLDEPAWECEECEAQALAESLQSDRVR